MEYRTDHTIGNLLGWWQLAGVDTLVSDSGHGWLTPVEPAKSVAAAATTDHASPQSFGEMPTSLPEFLSWLKTSPDVPEAAWANNRILPEITQPRDVMVISDMPDAEDMQADALFSSGVGRLLDAMLGAIGLDRGAIYLCSLASARPPGGMFDPASVERLAHIMRRHISLAAPKTLLLLGDKTSRALLTADAPEAKGKLQLLNHDRGTVAAIATFHPRFLMRQPAAKAECWSDLQMLLKGIAS
ncbi:MAG: uracil-DNA glycosylase [Alphaproteobacteria bacterium]|nr:uracil-DNA glycosylase [Alphaproteobacteria bacterium]